MTLQQDWDKEETANAVTTIFGYDENDDPRHSAIPVFLDEWFHGDFKTDRSDLLSSALDEKSLEEYADSFPAYRINSVVEIGFDTDGETIFDYEVQITDPGDPDTSGGLSPITLEGGTDEPDNPFRNKYDHYDDGQDDDYLPATQKGPHKQLDDGIQINGIDGIRGSIIFGGSDPYLEKLKEDGDTLSDIADSSVPDPIQRYFVHLPSFYTFLDFAFMADGAKAVRVWDASLYPAHALYVGGNKERQTVFREDIKWTADGPVWENSAFNKFSFEAQIPGITPFDQGGSFLYETYYDSVLGLGDHPVMRHAERGSSLSGETVQNELSDPLFPDSL